MLLCRVLLLPVPHVAEHADQLDQSLQEQSLGQGILSLQAAVSSGSPLHSCPPARAREATTLDLVFLPPEPQVTEQVDHWDHCPQEQLAGRIPPPQAQQRREELNVSVSLKPQSMG